MEFLHARIHHARLHELSATGQTPADFAPDVVVVHCARSRPTIRPAVQSRARLLSTLIAMRTTSWAATMTTTTESTSATAAAAPGAVVGRAAR